MNATVSQISSQRRAEERPIMLMMPLFMSPPVAPAGGCAEDWRAAQIASGSRRRRKGRGEESESGCGVGGGRRDGSDCMRKMTFKKYMQSVFVCAAARGSDEWFRYCTEKQTARNLRSVSADSNIGSDLFGKKKKKNDKPGFYRLLNVLFKYETIHYTPQSKYFSMHVKLLKWLWGDSASCY